MALKLASVLVNRVFKPTTSINSFQLISKLPYDRYYNQYYDQRPIKFIPIINITQSINPKPRKQGYYFNEQISCADDIVYITLKEFNEGDNKKMQNQMEYRALGFHTRLQQVMMASARNPISANAKWISFTCNGLGAKYGNNVIGMLENLHPEANPNMQVEFDIYNTVDCS